MPDLAWARTCRSRTRKLLIGGFGLTCSGSRTPLSLKPSGPSLVVEDHRVHRVRAKQLQPFLPASRLQDFIAVVFEQHLAADEPIPVVVNAENCCFQPRHHSFHIPSRIVASPETQSTSGRCAGPALAIQVCPEAPAPRPSIGFRRLVNIEQFGLIRIGYCRLCRTLK